MDDAGIRRPLEDVTAALKLKKGGMQHPFIYVYNQEPPNFFDAFVAQAYGRGATLFDGDQKAILRKMTPIIMVIQ